jgi:hypothetical protein
MKKRGNIIKMPRRFDFNVGYLVFVVIILYLIVSVIIFANRKKTVIYEVNTGSLALDNIYEGFIIRDEEVVKADYSGMVNYYAQSGDKADASSIIYSIDETGHVSELLEQFSDTTLRDDDINSIRDALSEYTLTYSDKAFDKIYASKSKITNSLSKSYYDIILNDLDNLIEESGNTTLFHKLKAEHTGIIMFTVDGYESMREDSLNSQIFDNKEYKQINLLENTIINKGDNAYRIINSDNWSVCVELSESDAATLATSDNVNVRFVDTGLTTNAEIDVLRFGDKIYGKISLKKYMINFADDRYVRIEITENSKSGLKIPVSSVLNKSFYTIPKNYMTGSGTFVRIFYSSKGEMLTEAVETTIYDLDDKYYYVSMDDFESGDILMEAETGNQYIVGTMGELTGVYCVNRGYAVFKKINIIDKNNEYYIVEKGSTYGLSVYDHIVLDHRTVKENELVD